MTLTKRTNVNIYQDLDTKFEEVFLIYGYNKELIKLKEYIINIISNINKYKEDDIASILKIKNIVVDDNGDLKISE